MSLTRINPSGENPFALGKSLFTSGEIVFAFGQSLLALGETVFRLREIVFGLWKVESILREIVFALGEIVFRLKQLVFGFREVEFMFKEFVCHRDVAERPSKMIESFHFQVLWGDQASISRISNCQEPPKAYPPLPPSVAGLSLLEKIPHAS